MFYPEHKLREVVRRVSNGVDFGAIAAQWQIPTEVVYDLAGMALYDVWLLCDDSWSMANTPDDPDRIADLELICDKVASIATLFDDDGINIRFMNSQYAPDNVRTTADVKNALARVSYNGITPMGTSAYKKIMEPYLRNARHTPPTKPILIIIVTDGTPQGEEITFESAVMRAHRSLQDMGMSPYSIAIQVAQVGNDIKAQKFLNELDNHHHIGHMIDCTANYEFEAGEMAKKGVSMSAYLWLLKLMVGAVDPEYDEKD
jgi:hypothetical protein